MLLNVPLKKSICWRVVALALPDAQEGARGLETADGRTVTLCRVRNEP